MVLHSIIWDSIFYLILPTGTPGAFLRAWVLDDDSHQKREYGMPPVVVNAPTFIKWTSGCFFSPTASFMVERQVVVVSKELNQRINLLFSLFWTLDAPTQTPVI